MLLWLENRETIAALTSLAFVPPKVSGPVAGTMPPAKFDGLHLLVCHALVNGERYSRVGLAGRTPRSGPGVSGLSADSAVSALLPVVVPVGAAPAITSHGCGVAPAVWRSSNVHGAAGALPAGKQPTIRRSAPEPLSGGLFVKYCQFGWSAAESRRSTRRSTAPVSASTSTVQAAGSRPLSTTLTSKARRTLRPVGTATSRTCWSWASPSTRSWPKPAREPRTDTPSAPTPTLRAAASQASWPVSRRSPWSAPPPASDDDA